MCSPDPSWTTPPPMHSLGRAPRWSVRSAVERDRQAVVALWREVDELHSRLAPLFFQHRRSTRDAAYAEMRFNRLLNAADAALLVADDETATPRGLIHIEICDTPDVPHMVRERRGYVEDLVVARTHRLKGCGRTLLQAGADYARRHGARQLLLTVWAANRVAQRFYSALGYHQVSQVLGIEL
jgi:ribosomal protein S18 acetylase RimI-like enzyme